MFGMYFGSMGSLPMVGYQPALDLNFASGSMPAGITFTRSSTATRFNAAGVLETVAADVPRFDYDLASLALKGLLLEEQRTNTIRNNTMQGAAVGAPGTVPLNWLATSGGGLSREIVGTGTEAGIGYIDVRFSGTGTSVTAQRMYFETAGTVAAANGQTWTLSPYLRLMAGSVPAGFFIGVDETGPGTTYIRTDQTNVVPLSVMARYPYSFTLTGGANVAFITPQLGFNSAVGVAVDFTVRIGMPQLELGGGATSVIPTTNAAATRATDAANMALPAGYDPTQGTLAAEYLYGGLGTLQVRAAQLDDGTENNRIILIDTGVSLNARGVVSVAAAGLLDISGPFPASTLRKTAFAFKAGDSAVTGGGQSTASAANPPSLPTVSRLRIGGMSTGSTGQQWSRRLRYYNTRLPNDALQSMTS